MQFQLPQSLLKQVVAYDPVLKPIYQKIEQAKNPKNPNAGPRLNLGVIDCLIPTDLISAEDQVKITTNLNQQEVARRIYQHDDDKCVVLIAHHKSQWMAWWFIKPSYLLGHPEVAKQHNYLFGFSLAFKNTSAAIEKFDGENLSLGWSSRNSKDLIRFDTYGKRSEVKTGRFKFIVKTVCITEEMVLGGVNVIPCRDKMNSYSTSMRHKRDAMYNWIELFSHSIPRWQDESLFSRVMEQGDIRVCVFGANTVAGDKSERSFNDILMESSIPYYRDGSTEFIEKVSQVLNTPYFKKEANKTFDEVLKLYSDPGTERKSEVKRPVSLFYHKVEKLHHFMRIYDNATLDHLQQMWELAGNISSIRVPSAQGVIDWLRENMPITSFIQIIAKKVEENADRLKNERYLDYRTGTYLVTLHELNDTLSMIEQLHKHQHGYNGSEKLELARPNRWRINEFHDYLAAECFKISTPNEKLPQDLFPQPIRIEEAGQKYSFFQPCDVHQLGSWGKAVRNCVGSADSYHKGIKSKTHFIVLVMLNNEPRYTVQAKLRNGQLTVEQIADVCNKSLTPGQRSMYEKTFGQALHVRAAELAPITETTELELTAQ
jgi:hypothetical protein